MQYSPVVRPIVTAIVDSIVNPDGSAIPGDGGGGVGAILKFHALTYDPTTYEMLGVKTGTGGLITTHTADALYAPDFEGIQRKFPANEPVWAGGRYVRQLCSSPNDLTVGWSVGNAATIVNSNTVTFDDKTYARIQITLPETIKVGALIEFTFDAWSEDSTAELLCAIKNNTTAVTQRKNVTIDNTKKRYIIRQSTTIDSNLALFYSNEGVARTVHIENINIIDRTPESSLINHETQPEMINEPDFNAIGDWIPGTSWSIANGKASYDGVVTQNLVQHLPLTIHTFYRLEVITSNGAYSDKGLRIRLGENTDIYLITSNGLHVFYLVANMFSDSPSLAVTFQGLIADGPCDIERVSLKELPITGVVEQQLEYGTKVYANGKSGSYNDTTSVVTEAVGTPLPELPYLQYYPQATNEQLSFDNWTGTTTVVQDQVGITGAVNSAFTLSDTSNTSNQNRVHSLSIVDDSSTHVSICRVKKTSGALSFPRLDIRLTGGSSVTGPGYLNTDNGKLYNLNSTNEWSGTYETIDEGNGFWKILLSYTNNSTGNINFSTTIYPAGVQPDGTNDATIVGSSVWQSIETHFNKTIAEVRGLGPIFTTTAPVTADSVRYSFDGSNASDDAVYYAEMMEDGLDTAGIFFIDNGAGTAPSIFSSHPAAGSIFSSGNANITQTRPAGVMFKAGSSRHVSDDSISVTVNGNTGTVQPWSGSGSSLPIYINGQYAGGTQVPFKMRELQRYNISSYQDGKDKIDELMT